MSRLAKHRLCPYFCTGHSLNTQNNLDRYTGLAVVVLHVLSAVYLTWTAGRSLAHSYKSLSPSQDVRLRLDRRRKLVPLFSGLALLGMGTALYSAVRYTTLSYRVWADERGYLPSDSTHRSATILNAHNPDSEH